VITTKYTLYTIIDKKNEITTPKLNFFPIYGKNIELSFRDDRISSDCGLLPLRELDNQLKLFFESSVTFIFFLFFAL